MNELVGQCFRVQTAWGDASLPWYVYRRVRTVQDRIATCHRFEVRSAQQAIGLSRMYVWMPEDLISVRLLLRQELIPESQWQYRWSDYIQDVGAPWNVE